jgi:hypothetical protein
LLGVDTTGRIGEANTLPSKIRTTESLILDGIVYEKNAVFPTGYSTSAGLYFKTTTKITSAFSSSVYNTLEISDNSGFMNFRSNYSSAKYRFYGGSSGTTSFLELDASRLYLPVNSIRLDINGFIEGFYGGSQNGNTYGRFVPFSNTNRSVFTNAFETGGFYFQTSRGSRSAVVTDMMSLMASGSLQLQDSGTFTDSWFNQLSVNNIYRGIRLPRSTTTQRNAYGVLASVPVTAGGTGYTSATVTFSSPAAGGTTATGGVNISGGVVTSISIYNPGTGYGGLTPTATFSGVAGSGATLGTVVVNTNTEDGTMLFNITEQAIEVANGSGGWNQFRPVLLGTAILDFPITSTGSSSSLTITVTGVATTDKGVYLQRTNASISGTFYEALITGANTVTVYFHNFSGSNQDPVSGNFNISVQK